LASQRRMLCVAHGFACGFNLTVPAHLDACASPLPEDPRWKVIDTSACSPYRDEAGAPRVFIAIFQAPCQVPTSTCRNFGMFEAVSGTDLPSGAAGLTEFEKRLTERNVRRQTDRIRIGRGGFLSNAEAEASGGHHTIKDRPEGGPHRIMFQAQLLEANDIISAFKKDVLFMFRGNGASRILSVDGKTMPAPSDWRLAEGDLITSRSSGQVEIGRVRSPRLILDMSDEDNPRREIR
jgi:hypothetical protein